MSDSEHQAQACPWCGEEPTEIVCEYEDTDNGETVWGARVACSCGVTGPFSANYEDEHDAAAEAVTLWNEVAGA